MSPYKCISGIIRKGKKPRKSNMYDLFSRKKSDAIRVEIASCLGFSNSDGLTPLEFFNSLESPSLQEVYGLPTQEMFNLLQCRALFSKDADIISDVDRKGVAFESFLESERSCEQVNEAFRNGTIWTTSPDLGSIFHIAQRKISNILGEAPSIDELRLQFGPGASTSCRKITTARRKLSTVPSITISSLPVLSEIRETLPHYSPKSEHVDEAVIEFVPKNLKTDRLICIEPTVSGMIQKGIGSYMKKKLLHAGVDLRDQTINKNRARLGSLNGNLSTVDLEKASDSIATGLVLDLLPIEWFQLLDNFRSRSVRYKDKVYRLHKFSSMGNGYTFELESLIFYALSFAIASHFGIPSDITVYGDDLVLPTPLYPFIENFFPIVGFSVNKEKSFSKGAFRESCGGDFWSGVNTRPLYIKGRLKFFDLFRIYNFLYRNEQFDPDQKIRRLILSKIPAFLLRWGPDGYGDGHLCSSSYQRTPFRRNRGWSGYTFHTVVKLPYKDSTTYENDWLFPIYESSLINKKVLSPELDCRRYVSLRHIALHSRQLEIKKELEQLEDSRRGLRNERAEGRVTRIYVLGD